MAKQQEQYLELINKKYIDNLRNAMVMHDRLNIQALSMKFGISSGNTYFRNFINFENSTLGMSGFSKIVESCGYTFRLVPVKSDDINALTHVEQLTEDAFKEINQTVCDFAMRTQKAPKRKKSIPKVINNTTLIQDSLFDDTNGNVPVFDDDDDDLFIGSDEDIDVDPNDF